MKAQGLEPWTYGLKVPYALMRNAAEVVEGVEMETPGVLSQPDREGWWWFLPDNKRRPRWLEGADLNSPLSVRVVDLNVFEPIQDEPILRVVIAGMFIDPRDCNGMWQSNPLPQAMAMEVRRRKRDAG